jgi:hypothetical protein
MNLQTEIAAGVTSTDAAPAALLDYRLYPNKSRRLVVDVSELPCKDMVMVEHPQVTLKRCGATFIFTFTTDAPVTVYFRDKGHTQ